jgi:hypothetical protein
MRFIRPGMTRVKASSDVPLLRVIAFKNDTRGSFSVVMLNGTTDDLQVTLNSTGTIPDSLEMRTSTQAAGFVEGPLRFRRGVWCRWGFGFGGGGSRLIRKRLWNRARHVRPYTGVIARTDKLDCLICGVGC